MRDVFSPILLLTLLLLILHPQAVIAADLLSPLYLSAFILAFTFFCLKKYRSSYALIAAALALFVLWGLIRQEEQYTRALDVPPLPADYLSFSGSLLDYPEIQNESSLLQVRVTEFEFARQRLRHTLNLQIKVMGDCRWLYRGDRIQMSARIFPRQFIRNFRPNPLETTMFVRAIHAGGISKSVQLVNRTGRGHPFWRLIGSWRNRIRSEIEKRFSANGRLDERGVFLEATLLGDRGRLDSSWREELIRSGVFHLLAISGANIGMVALLSLALLKRLRFSLRSRYLATALLILLYLVISGFDISAWRAVLMALLIFLARVLYLDVAVSTLISFSGFLILVSNPAQYLDPGFVLTYALTAVLVIGRRLWLSALKKIPNFLAELLVANTSCTLFSLPLSLFFFNRYSFSGFFSGLLLIPLTTLITGASVLLLPLALLSSTLCQGLLLLADPVLTLFGAVTRLMAVHLDASIWRPAPPLPLLILIFAIFFLLGLKKAKPVVQALLYLLLAGLLIFLALPPQRYRPARLETYYLDVGHGDAALAVFPGGQALLIDGGGSTFSEFEVGRAYLLPFLAESRIRVSWVAITHFHPDHVRGILEILPTLKPREVWISSEAAADPYFHQLQEEIRPPTLLRRIAAGWLHEASGCRIELLHPFRYIRADFSENNHSQVWRIADDSHAFLFAGDVERSVENELLTAGPQRLRADVLKIAHHGSASSSSLPFLAAVRPKLAVISEAAANPFGLPHPRVLSDLKRLGIGWLSTARRGGIRVRSLPDVLEIETSK